MSQKDSSAAISERTGRNQILLLQRLAGNQAVSQRFGARPVVQRWSSAELKTSDPTQFAYLKAKIPGWGAEADLARLAAITDTPLQLKTMLDTGVGAKSIEDGIKGFGAAAVVGLIAKVDGPSLKGVLDELVKYKAHLKFTAPATDMASFLTGPPAATADTVKALVAGAKQRGEGLVAGNGTVIPQKTPGTVVGDGLPDESAAVISAVNKLGKGELVSRGPHDNNAGRLPGVRGAGGYTEYDVTPPPGTTDRGPRRLVVNNTTKFVYYTHDHYVTFTRVK